MDSIENFPDTDALDADITHIPLGPQDPSIQTALSHTFKQHNHVKTVVVQHEHRRTRGGVQFLLHLDKSDDGVAIARNIAQNHVTAPLAYSVVETPDRVGPAWPPDTSIDATITVYRHPLAPFINSIVGSDHSVFDISYAWPVQNPEFSSSPMTVSWDDIPSLTVTLTGPEPSLDDVTTTIMERIVSTHPHAYAVDISRDHADGERVISLGFTRQTYSNPETKIYRARGQHLNRIVDDDTIQLTVTSPPYLDAIDYDTYASSDGTDDWASGDDGSVDNKLDVWKTVQRDVFSSVYDATRDGGYCAVVIGHVKAGDDTWVPLPHEFMSVMDDIGWEFHERIVWNKVTNGSPRFGTTIQNPYPTYYYPNQMHEEIIVLRKGDPVRRQDSTEELVMSDVMKSDVANNVWHIPPVPHNKDIDHPAPFPEELVHRLVVLYSHPGDVVADPMIGSGTTGVVADQLDRIVIGTEQQSLFASTARNRIATESYERSNQLIPSYERVDSDSDRTTLTQRTDDSHEHESVTGDQSTLSSF